MPDLEQLDALAKAATPGEWLVWNGPQYVGGGADLCIGVGDTWLANMDHRNCVNRMHHMGCHEEGCKLQGEADICSFSSEISVEQSANAAFIAAANPATVLALIAQARQLAQVKALVETLKGEAARLEKIPIGWDDIHRGKAVQIRSIVADLQRITGEQR